jgi:hypothetical protein
VGQWTKATTQQETIQRKTRRKRKRKRKILIQQNVPIKFNNRNSHNNYKHNPIIDPKYPAVYNIAETYLTTPEKELLQKGLKFCPNNDKPIHSDYLASIDELHRKLLIKGYFMAQDTSDTSDDNQQQNQSPDSKFVKINTPKSNWKPSFGQQRKIPIAIRVFAEDIRDTLKKISKPSGTYKNNLNKRQNIALRKLQANKNIIIRQADKGSGVVVMTKDQYKNEILRQLNNQDHYEKLDVDTSNLIRNNIQQATSSYNQSGLLSKKAFNIINKPGTRPAKFYTLPKIHKSLENPPGRPIMSGNNHPTEMLSQFVDLHINPMLKHIGSYIKDTKHFIDMCKDITLEQDDKIITLDISSLYTNIPHEEGIEAILKFMTPHLGKQKAEMIAKMTKMAICIFKSRVQPWDHGWPRDTPAFSLPNWKKRY